MKKVLLLISLIFLLSGCYNYKELNDYAIATGMAIDYKDDKYKVSLLISNSPKNGSEASASYQTVVYSGKGKSIYDAIKEIGLISPKEIYIGHISIVILSEETAKNGLNGALDFLLAEPRSKKNFYIALTKDTDAKDVLSITTPLTDFPSQTLADNLESTDYLQGAVVAIDFNTLLYQLINQGIEPVLNGFEVKGDEEKGVKASNTETNNPKAYVQLSTLGIFKDDKFITWANQNQSRGINIINNKIQELYIEVDCKGGKIVIATEKLKTKRKVDKKGNVTIEANAKGIINETSCNIDLTKENTITKIEKKTEKKINKFIKEAIYIAQEYKTDIFGIGLNYYQHHPKKFDKIDDWNEHFANIEFKINVDVDLNHTGSVQQSIERITDEKNN